MTFFNRFYQILLVLGIQLTSEAGELENIGWSVRLDISNAFNYGGITGVKSWIYQNLDAWIAKAEINIGVTGNSGVGKSSFINAIRGLTAEDRGAAEVGVTETTATMKPYSYPGDDKIVLWDLPGIGTPRFRQYQYLDSIQARKLDYFIIISSDRFTENDLWLARKLKGLKKSFYFVRSKVSQDIENNRRSHPRSHEDRAVLKQIRDNCNDNLVNAGIGWNTKMYLIDNYDTDRFDFNLLSFKIKEEAPSMKRDAMKTSLIELADELIQEEKKSLSKRITSIAVGSGVVGAIPVPGLDIAVDIAALLEEVFHYRRRFGLDSESVRKCAFTFRQRDVERFKRSLRLNSDVIEYTATGLMTYFAKIGLVHGTSYVTSNILKYTLPIIGNIASAAASYTTTQICLNNLLDLMAADAEKINNELDIDNY